MNRISCRQIHCRSGQSGASAVEFALIFPILLAIVYCGIVYMYVFVVQQAINFAAQQGAQAAVSLVPTSSASTDQQTRLSLANTVALASLNWLPTTQLTRIVPSTPAACGSLQPGSNTFVYQINFGLGPASPGGALFPSLVNLPYFQSNIPPLPATLVACAIAFT